jgi:hypothetical protein
MLCSDDVALVEKKRKRKKKKITAKRKTSEKEKIEHGHTGSEKGFAAADTCP